MTKVEFAETLEKYYLRRERNKKLALLSTIIFCFLAVVLRNSEAAISYVIFGAVTLVNFINYSVNNEDVRLLVKAVELLTEEQNT